MDPKKRCEAVRSLKMRGYTVRESSPETDRMDNGRWSLRVWDGGIFGYSLKTDEETFVNVWFKGMKVKEALKLLEEKMRAEDLQIEDTRRCAR